MDGSVKYPIRLHKNKKDRWCLTKYVKLLGCSCCWGDETIDVYDSRWDEWFQEYYKEYAGRMSELELERNTILEFLSCQK